MDPQLLLRVRVANIMNARLVGANVGNRTLESRYNRHSLSVTLELDGDRPCRNLEFSEHERR